MLTRILKYMISGKDMEELERRRLLMTEYQLHLADFPDIALVLKNMEEVATIENSDHTWGNKDTLKTVDLYHKVASLRKLCYSCEKELEEYHNSFIKKE